MNTFDFYFVIVTASTKTALKKAGIDKNKIERRREGSAVYGNRVFPRWSYRATVGYFDLAQSAQADQLAATFAGKGVLSSVQYHCAD